jgi:hypothetical protein
MDGNLPSLLTRLNAKSSHPSGTFCVMTPDQALKVLPALIKDAKAFWIPVHRCLTRPAAGWEELLILQQQCERELKAIC